MKISKIFYYSLLIIGTCLVFAFCIKIIFFPSNNNSLASNINSPASESKFTIELNTKYFDEIYSEYKKINQSKNVLLTEKQFLNILYCFFVISQFDPIDYAKMIINILEKNPLLVENFMSKSIENFKDGFEWLSNLDKNLFITKSLDKKEKNSTYGEKILDISYQIEASFKDPEQLVESESFKETRNDIKAIFNTTSLNTQHLQKLLMFCDIHFSNEDLLIKNKSILMKPAIFYAIDFIKYNWLKTLSTDMEKNAFLSEFTTPEGTFSYFYVSLYSWLFVMTN